jgi:acetyl-CoA synthetase
MTKGFLGNPQKYLDTYFEKFGSQVWYHGDWALKDDDGFWFLKGRSDDTIKVAGKRVGPNEYESAMMEDDRIQEAAAVGIPHEIKGECVYCFIVLKDPQLDPQPVKSALEERVGRKMGKALSPEKIIFVRSLPKTRSGKILRGLIRKIQLQESFDDSAVENPDSLQAIRESLRV